MIGLVFISEMGNKEELKLGPYAGTPTDHTTIPFGKGICGQVAVSNQNFVVPGCESSGQLHRLQYQRQVRNCSSIVCQRRKCWTN